jgi:hypothetical protein
VFGESHRALRCEEKKIIVNYLADIGVKQDSFDYNINIRMFQNNNFIATLKHSRKLDQKKKRVKNPRLRRNEMFNKLTFWIKSTLFLKI